MMRSSGNAQRIKPGILPPKAFADDRQRNRRLASATPGFGNVATILCRQCLQLGAHVLILPLRENYEITACHFECLYTHPFGGSFAFNHGIIARSLRPVTSTGCELSAS